MGKASKKRQVVNEHPRVDRLLIAGAVAIALMTLAAYWPAIHGGFIWDDDAYLTQNPLITAPDGLARIWFSTEQTSQYFPLVYTTFRMEHALWGMNPIGYHAVNVLLHILSALLLWTLLRRLKIPGAWIAAERKNCLSTVFYLLVLLTSLRFMDATDRLRWRYHACGLILCALALFAKTTACTLPAAILVIHWFRGRKVDRAAFLRIIPFAVIGVAMGYVSIWWERNIQGTYGSEFAFGFIDRLLVAARAIWFYLGKLVWPTKLTFSYPRWEINPHAPAQYVWPVVCIAAVILLWRFRKSGRGPIAAAVFFAAALSPMLGFINLFTFKYTFVADHYQYVACMGPIALFAAFISRGWRDRKMYVGLRYVLPCAILIVLGFLTWRQAHVYTDSESLWRDTIAKNPTCWLAHNNLANLLDRRGDTDEAVPHYQETIRLNPDFAEGHLNYGIVLCDRGMLDQGIAQYKEALRIAPDWPDAYYDLGVAYASQGKVNEAVSAYRAAIDLRPEYVEAHNNLGVALIAQGHPDEAIEHFRFVLAADPNMGGAHENLAVALYDLRRYAEAWQEVRLAIECGNNPNPAFLEALSRKMPPP
jgi:tetratricopeptide (TPR) repeat protein